MIFGAPFAPDGDHELVDLGVGFLELAADERVVVVDAEEGLAEFGEELHGVFHGVVIDGAAVDEHDLVVFTGLFGLSLSLSLSFSLSLSLSFSLFLSLSLSVSFSVSFSLSFFVSVCQWASGCQQRPKRSSWREGIMGKS